uniref:Apolipoprotein L n=1 Tax=Seriola dumerili TaxID=41447 RepID=A0A3B4VP25_SERDU
MSSYLMIYYFIYYFISFYINIGWIAIKSVTHIHVLFWMTCNCIKCIIYSHLISSFVFIRMNQHFRTAFLFPEESCSAFISEFNKRHPRMLQCLKDLEDIAVQLDKMSKGAKISSVAGSSVGAVGGVLSIVGLALIPVTAGVSLALTMTGVGLGITSGVNSAATAATEVGVNDCLEEVTSQTVITGVGKMVAQEGKALRNVPRVASDIPDIGQAAVKGPLGISNPARAGFIGINALFLGMDIFFICKDSIGLAKGSETKVSKFIRARAALLSSEIDCCVYMTANRMTLMELVKT